MKISKSLRGSLLLLLTALIWGISFVSQSEGGDSVGPFSFNGMRMVIGALALIPVIRMLDKLGFSPKKPASDADKKKLLKGGLVCGVIMFVASNLQQVGMYFGTNAGKAGFLTAVYILIVPILGLFMKKKCGINVWIAVGITLVGLYLLCITDGFSFAASDLIVLLCALAFAFHIVVVDKLSPVVDGVRLSCLQFLIGGLLTMIVSAAVEIAPMGFPAWIAQFGTRTALISLSYSAFMSCGVAYTLQIIGQDGVDPTIASLLMSLESVFAVLGAWVILGEALTTRELVGCVIIFAAIILAQVDLKKIIVRS